VKKTLPTGYVKSVTVAEAPVPPPPLKLTVTGATYPVPPLVN